MFCGSEELPSLGADFTCGHTLRHALPAVARESSGDVVGHQDEEDRDVTPRNPRFSTATVV